MVRMVVTVGKHFQAELQCLKVVESCRIWEAGNCLVGLQVDLALYLAALMLVLSSGLLALRSASAEGLPPWLC
jgi:hypothetical protein